MFQEEEVVLSMRRILMVLTVAALMVAMMAASAFPAFADEIIPSQACDASSSDNASDIAPHFDFSDDCVAGPPAKAKRI
jgi:hypothetical protein